MSLCLGIKPEQQCLGLKPEQQCLTLIPKNESKKYFVPIILDTCDPETFPKLKLAEFEGFQLKAWRILGTRRRLIGLSMPNQLEFTKLLAYNHRIRQA